MKANYNRKVNAKERSVAFRTKDKAFCLYQSTVYDKMPDDKYVVYLDFENDTQIDKLINTLQALKNSTQTKNEEDDHENCTESR